MILKRIGPWSCAKVSMVLYAVMGLLVGLMFSFFGLVLGSLGTGSDIPTGAIGALFGVGAIIILPIFYGVLGFITGALTAWVYNLIAQYVGGLEIDLEVEPSAPAPPTQG